MGFMESGDPAEPLRAGMEAGAGVWRNKRLCASFLSFPVPSCLLRHRSTALTTSEWWFCDSDFRSRIKPAKKKRDRKTRSCSFQSEEATMIKPEVCFSELSLQPSSDLHMTSIKTLIMNLKCSD